MARRRHKAGTNLLLITSLECCRQRGNPLHVQLPQEAKEISQLQVGHSVSASIITKDTVLHRQHRLTSFSPFQRVHSRQAGSILPQRG